MVSDDILNISDQPQIIDNFQLLDDEAKREEIDLPPAEAYSLSLDNPGGSLIMKHSALSSFSSVHLNQSPTNRQNYLESAVSPSVSNQSNVDSDCICLKYQQVNELSSETTAKSNDLAGLEDEMDCQIMESKDPQTNEQLGEQPASKPRPEPIIVQKEAILGEPKTRTITLKMPPINGQKEPNNLILKIENDKATPERPISSSPSFKSPTKTGTTRPTIQTINPTPKLIIKPLPPPSSQAVVSSTVLPPVTSARTSKTNDSAPEKVKTRCLRAGCTEPAVKNPQWDEEYCSAECLIEFCKACFKNWAANRQNASC